MRSGEGREEQGDEIEGRKDLTTYWGERKGENKEHPP